MESPSGTPQQHHSPELAPHHALERVRTRDSVKSQNEDDGGDADESMNARETLAELRRIKPPRKRFLEVSSANELKLGEVEELLREYRRLAKAIGEAIAT